MKVIAILEHSITGGGGFNQALNAILQMKKICKGRFEFEVFSTHAENYAHLQKLGISSVIFSYSLMDKLLAKIGINCHLCPREGCSQRAHQPMVKELNFDPSRRGNTRYDA